ncbi:MAG: hypothetical protein K2H20_04945 [Bacilli bacterium]|nr:hypothetical protein [Bacilli bacterium]
MYDTEALESLIVVLGGFIIIAVIALIAWLIFYIIGMWKMYEKAGQPGWKAIIPYYNTWTLVEIAGLNWYWFLVALASTVISVLGLEGISFVGSIAGLIANINIYHNLSKKFNKSTGWIVLSVFFGGFTLPILGYSKADVWNSAVAVTPNGLFDAKNAPASNVTSQQQVTPQPMAQPQPQTVVTPEPQNVDNNNNQQQ